MCAYLAGIARAGVALEHLLPVDAEAVQRGVRHDLVVQRLPAQPLAVGVHRHRGDGVHARVGNVLDLQTGPPQCGHIPLNTDHGSACVWLA